MKGWPLTGRAAEMAQIIASLGSRRGARRGVVLCGPAGVGKTRLAQEAAAWASQRGAVVRWVLCTPACKTVPMGALAPWCDAVDGNPLDLVNQVIATITAGAGEAPLVLAIDDAHHLDDLSAFVVYQLVSREVVALIATIRTGEEVSPAVVALRQLDTIECLELQPLTYRDSEHLLTHTLGGPVRPDSAMRLWNLTGGNVLYLRELVSQAYRSGNLVEHDDGWAWTADIALTPSLIELVGLHAGSTSGAVRDLIDMVAAAEPVERACLVEIIGQATLNDAEQHELIVAASDSGDLVRLRHPLYGEVRLAQAGRYRLQRLRGKLAAALAARPDADPVRVGVLWLDSDLEPDGTVLLRAAEQAVVRLDLALGAKLAEAAMHADGSTEAAMLFAHLLVLLNKGDEADRLLTATERGSVPELTRANALHLRIANLLWPLGRPDEAWQVSDAALRSSSSELLTAHVRAVRAVQFAMAGHPAAVLEELDGVDRDRLLTLPALVALWGLTIAYGDLGDPEAATRYAEEGYRRAAAAPDSTYQGVALVEFHIYALVFAGLIAQGNELAEKTCDRCSDAPGISRSVSIAMRGMAALFAADLPRSVQCLTTACEDFAQYGVDSAVFYNFSAFCTEALARSGRVTEALLMQARMHAARHPTFVFSENDIQLADAWVAAARGHITASRRLARAAAEVARRAGQPAREVYSLQILLQLGGADASVTARLEQLRGCVQGPRVDIAARYAQALDAGDGDALLAVGNELATIGDHLGSADATAQAVAAFSAQGKRGSALTATELVTGLATARDIRSPAVNAVMSPLPLSEHEREIVVMIAEGRSNTEIAAELGGSARTLEGHIARASAKVKVAGRRGLAEYGIQHESLAGYR